MFVHGEWWIAMAENPIKHNVSYVNMTILLSTMVNIIVINQYHWCYEFLSGQYQCVSLINNFFAKDDLAYYTKIQGKFYI